DEVEVPQGPLEHPARLEVLGVPPSLPGVPAGPEVGEHGEGVAPAGESGAPVGLAQLVLGFWQTSRSMAGDLTGLDPIDRDIVRVLREHGRISWQDLGPRVGLSPNAAADRVRRLERRRV